MQRRVEKLRVTEGYIQFATDVDFSATALFRETVTQSLLSVIDCTLTLEQLFYQNEQIRNAVTVSIMN